MKLEGKTNTKKTSADRSTIIKLKINFEDKVWDCKADLGVSENRGPLFWGPCNRGPTI